MDEEILITDLKDLSHQSKVTFYFCVLSNNRIVLNSRFSYKVIGKNLDERDLFEFLFPAIRSYPRKNICSCSCRRSRASLCKMAESVGQGESLNSWSYFTTFRFTCKLLILWKSRHFSFLFLFSSMRNTLAVAVSQITRDLVLPRFSWQNVIKVPLIRRERSCSFGETDEPRRSSQRETPKNDEARDKSF